MTDRDLAAECKRCGQECLFGPDSKACSDNIIGRLHSENDALRAELAGATEELDQHSKLANETIVQLRAERDGLVDALQKMQEPTELPSGQACIKLRSIAEQALAELVKKGNGNANR